jgi:uncharacterized protein YheU (UPF0270 family)
MEISYKDLNKDTLYAIVEAFILREGTDYGETEFTLEEKVEQIINQLEAGKVYISFDEKSKSCNIVSR